MSVKFIPSQIAGPDNSQKPIPYNGDPSRLVWSDIQLFARNFKTVPGILRPARFWSTDSSRWDELYLSPGNILCLLLHGVLIFTQLGFLFSVPLLLGLPGYWALCIIASFLTGNRLITYIINGGKPALEPSKKYQFDGHENEFWLFINGVSVGRTWLQSNIDRLTLTFGRNVTGILNPTSGIVFDLFQCLLQRNFSHYNSDIREGFAQLKPRLEDPKIDKVVLILHSQGGIEGGLIIDMLLAEMSQDYLNKLEVYTFGNAANHFNNPTRVAASHPPSSSQTSQQNGLGNGTSPTPINDLDPIAEETPGNQPNGTSPTLTIAPLTKITTMHTSHPTNAIRHIEHYANAGDFVAQFGVLAYSSLKSRFMGRVFMSTKTGHLLNQHYLYNMFPLDEGMGENARPRASEKNDFMASYIEVSADPDDFQCEDPGRLWHLGHSDPAARHRHRRHSVKDSVVVSGASGSGVATPVEPVVVRSWSLHERALTPGRRYRVEELSRLWQYRNGRSPPN